jgi:GLPGLI family protein
MRTFIIFSFLVFFSTNLISCDSKKKFEGKIEFDILYDLAPEMESQRGMFATSMTYYIGNKFTRLTQQSSIGEQSTIYLTKSKQTISLINLNDQKFAVTQETEEEAKDYKVEVLKETKTIAGFKCKKAIVYLPGKNGQPDIPTEVFYTESIPAEYNSQFPGVKGFVLEYKINAQGMVITYTAKTATPEPVDITLSEIPSDYSKMTVSEFMIMMGGGK